MLDIVRKTSLRSWQGTVVDDTIIFKLEESNYLAVVNSGMAARVVQHLISYKTDQGVEVTDLTDKVAKIDIQGPMSAKFLKPLLAEPESVLEDMPYFSFKGHFDARTALADTVILVDGTPILLSRTGYTGEFGFEIFVDPTQVLNVWEKLLSNQTLFLEDKRRIIRVRVADDIRPHRTARGPTELMI
jgi:aminomethyltransferase